MQRVSSSAVSRRSAVVVRADNALIVNTKVSACEYVRVCVSVLVGAWRLTDDQSVFFALSAPLQGGGHAFVGYYLAKALKAKGHRWGARARTFARSG